MTNVPYSYKMLIAENLGMEPMGIFYAIFAIFL